MIIGTKINSKKFFFHKQYNKFSQEISSLGDSNAFGRLYDDACDEGFVIVSDKTGVEVPFCLSSVEKSSEGDIQAWNFKSAANRYSQLSKLTAVIFND